MTLRWRRCSYYHRSVLRSRWGVSGDWPEWVSWCYKEWQLDCVSSRIFPRVSLIFAASSFMTGCLGTKPHLKDYGKQLSGVWESWQALVELPVDCKLGMYSLGWLELSGQVAIMDWGDRHRSTDEDDNASTECTDGGSVSEGTAGLVAKCEAGSVSEVTCGRYCWFCGRYCRCCLRCIYWDDSSLVSIEDN